MAKTKISEFSATPANNTDIDSINIAEGCAPSGINDAIRELMAQLKDFQTGAVGDSFNGPIGATTAGTGAFTTLSASSTTTLSGLTASTALALDASKNVVSVTNTGTGNNVLATSPTLVTPILGTPTSGTLTNATGLPIATGVSGLGSGVATFLATPSSANLLGALTDETGTGSAVFATSPTLVTPTLGVATATSLQGIIGNVTPAAGSFTTLGASSTATLNTLSSSGATLTGGTINGMTVGATTASSGAFTTVTASTAIGTASGGTGLGGATPFTANGVVFASSTSALSTGSALTYNGTALTAVNNSNTLSIVLSRTDATARNFALGVDADGAFRISDLGTSGVVVLTAGAAGITTLNSASELVFKSSNTEGMRLTTTGLGIGTSSPAVGLAIQGTTADAVTIQLKQNAAGGQDYRITSRDDGSLRFNNDTAAAERMRIDSAGNVGIGTTSPAAKLDVVGTIKGSTTIGVGAATPSTSGAGITFPATQSASSNANTLDDYEEGTWTPSLGGFSSITFSAQTGTYTKIGNVVNVVCNIVVSGGTPTVADLLVNNLPFTSASQLNSGGSWGYGFGVVASSVGLPQLRINASATSVSLLNTAGAVLAGTDSNTATPTINFSATYTV